ncbi:MAG: EamA family transporter [Bacillota bacterium]
MDKKKAFLYTFFGACCWGLAGCFGEYLLVEKNLDPMWIVNVRLLLAGILLLGFALRSQSKEIFLIFHDKKDRIQLFWFACLGLATCQATYFIAIQHSNVATATVIQSLNPLVIIIYLALVTRKMPKTMEILAIVVAFTGVFLLSTKGDISSMVLSQFGLFSALVSAGCVAAFSLLSRRLLQKFGSNIAIGFGMLLGGIALTPFVRFWEVHIDWDLATFGAMAGVVVLGTAMSFTFFLKGVSVIGSFMGSLIGMVEPVIAVVVSVMIFGHHFTMIEFFGFILILGAVLGLTIYTKKLEEKEKEKESPKELPIEK